MIKNIFKNQKGISLVSLGVTIVILVIITNMLVYNAKDGLQINKLSALYNDIENLNDKVSAYYAQYGKIPAQFEYTRTEDIQNANILGANDTGKFYVIDLSAMEGITLNYGKDYKQIKVAMTQDEIDSLKDIYIINENSHNIFYVQGITVDEKTYYAKVEKDEQKVNLKYVEGVKIPEGFYYVGGTKEEGLVISDVVGDDLENTKGGNQFVWVPIKNNIVADDESCADDEATFVNSVNAYKGFYISRYEAGVENGTFSLTEYDSSNYQAPTDVWTAWSGGTIVSKKDAIVWNYITGKKAQELCENMYTTQNIQNCNVHGRLISYNAYNELLQVLGKENETDYSNWGNCYSSNFKIDSKNARYITGNGTADYQSATGEKAKSTQMLLTSGASEQNKVKNIYDLAGNVLEYTSRINKNANTITYLGSSYQQEGTYINKIENYINTANTDMGFHIVLYLDIDETKWSPAYDKETTYIDENGDTANIPQGFKVSLSEGMNKISEGLVGKDSKDNEWVWVEVPKSIYKNVLSDTDYDNIKASMIEYAKDYRKGSSTQNYNWADEWYAKDGNTVVTASTENLTDSQKALNNGCGLTYDQYKTNYENMLKSVYNNGGFWISRYEIGDSTATAGNTTRTGGTTGVAVNQANQIPYNYVTCSQAQSLASGMNIGIPNKTASLLFGIQWDLTCKFIEEKSNLELVDIKTNSTNWGNYKNKSLTLNRGKYNIKPNDSTSVWTSYTTPTENYVVDGKTSDDESYYQLLTTGASDETKVMNIYDFAGNEFEWTLEFAYTFSPCVLRGGSYDVNSSSRPASSRFGIGTSRSDGDIAFRSSLF